MEDGSGLVAVALDAASYLHFLIQSLKPTSSIKTGSIETRFNPGWREGSTPMMVDHKIARERALATYKARLSVKEQWSADDNDKAKVLKRLYPST